MMLYCQTNFLLLERPNYEADPIEVVPPMETLKIVKPSIASDWRSPRSPEDQSDARSTESPTESVCDRDEGFETEETQSAIIRRQQALQLPTRALGGPAPSSLPSNTKPIIRPIRQPIYMSMTKASSMRGNLNSIDKPGLAKPAASLSKPGSRVRSSSSASAIGNSYKKVVDSISNKKTQTKITSGDLQGSKSSLANPAKSSVSNMPLSVPKFNPADYRTKPPTLLRSNTNASSSSQEECPVRKPSATNVNSTKSTSNSKLVSSIKTPRTTASKQKLIQMRNKVEALKDDNASSSDSERLSPSTTQKRIQPKLTKNAPKTTSADAQPVRKTSAAGANNKTLQRLLSPPKTTRHDSTSMISTTTVTTITKVYANPIRNGLAPSNALSRSGSVRNDVGFNKGLTNGQNGSVPSPSTVSQQILQIAVPAKRAQSLEPSVMKSKKTWR